MGMSAIRPVPQGPGFLLCNFGSRQRLRRAWTPKVRTSLGKTLLSAKKRVQR